MTVKKLWKKQKVPILNIGECRYCKEEMVSTESFVAFLDKTKAHYKCMKEDDEKKNIN